MTPPGASCGLQALMFSSPSPVASRITHPSRSPHVVQNLPMASGTLQCSPGPSCGLEDISVTFRTPSPWPPGPSHVLQDHTVTSMALPSPPGPLDGLQGPLQDHPVSSSLSPVVFVGSGRVCDPRSVWGFPAPRSINPKSPGKILQILPRVWGQPGTLKGPKGVWGPGILGFRSLGSRNLGSGNLESSSEAELDLEVYSNLKKTLYKTSKP